MFQTLFGIPSELVVALAFDAVPKVAIVTLLLVIAIQQWQIKRGQAYIAYRFGAGPAPRQRDNVTPLRRRRRSG